MLRSSGSCENPPIEARKDCARPLQSRGRESIKPASRTPGCGWVDVLPFGDQPSRALEPEQYGIQGTRGDPAALMNIGPRHLLERILEEGLQDPQGLEGHTHIVGRLTHGSNST